MIFYKCYALLYIARLGSPLYLSINGTSYSACIFIINNKLFSLITPDTCLNLHNDLTI